MIALRQPLIACLILLLGGCTLFQQQGESAGTPPAAEPPVEERPPEPSVPAPPPAVQAPIDVERALTYFDRLRRLTSTELPREQEAVRQAYAQSHSDFDRVRLAMTYALPNTPVSDEGRALDLVEPLIKNTRAELHHLAVLMGVFAQEQRRLSAHVQTLQQGVQSLQQKLDALRSLERSLIERESGAGRRK